MLHISYTIYNALIIHITFLLSLNKLNNAVDWTITVAYNPEVKTNENDCPWLAQLCQTVPCQHIKPALPTESIFVGESGFKMNPFVGSENPDDSNEQMACVSSEWFSNSQPGFTMTAITVINPSKTVQLKTLTALESQPGKWKVDDHKKIDESTENKLCKELISAGCNEQLSDCMGPDEQNKLPYLKTKPSKLEPFTKFLTCQDGGKIQGKECQEALCLIHGGSDEEGHVTMAILKCQDQNYPATIYYDSKDKIWCLSSYSDPKKAANAQESDEMLTLKDYLLTDKMPEKFVDRILNQWDPIVTSIKFRRDVLTKLQSEKYSSYYDSLSQSTPEFDHPLSEIQLNMGLKEQLAGLYNCDFEHSNPDNSCKDLRWNPWAMLQLIIQQNPEKFKTIEKFNDAPDTKVNAASGDAMEAIHKQEDHKKEKCYAFGLLCLKSDVEKEQGARRRRRMINNLEESTAAGKLVDKPVKFIITTISVLISICLTIASFFIMYKQL